MSSSRDLQLLKRDMLAEVGKLPLWSAGSEAEVAWALLEAHFRTTVAAATVCAVDSEEKAGVDAYVTNPLPAALNFLSLRPSPDWARPRALRESCIRAAAAAQPVLDQAAEVFALIRLAERGAMQLSLREGTAEFRHSDGFAAARKIRRQHSEDTIRAGFRSRGDYVDALARLHEEQRRSREQTALVGRGGAGLSAPPASLIEAVHAVTMSMFPDLPYVRRVLQHAGVDYEDTRKVAACLYRWAGGVRDAYRQAALAWPLDRWPSGVRPATLAVRLDQCQRILSQHAGVPEACARFVTEALAAPPCSFGGLVHPLISLADGYVLICPSVMLLAFVAPILATAAEHAGRVPGSIQKEKGRILEEEVRGVLERAWPASVAWPTPKFDSRYRNGSDSGDLDAGLLDLASGQALLVQCKYLSPGKAPRGIDDDLHEAQRQIRRALDYVRQQQDDFTRRLAQVTGLPPLERCGLVVTLWDIGSPAIRDREYPVVTLAELEQRLATRTYDTPRDMLEAIRRDNADVERRAQPARRDFVFGGYRYVVDYLVDADRAI